MGKILEEQFEEYVKFKRVNACETIAELQQCILDFAGEDGFIQGRTRKFDAQKMADNAKHYYDGQIIPNVITREFGLRQQAMYIKYYDGEHI